MIFHSEIAADVTLGSSLWIPHPYGIVMARGTEIGDNCAIYQRTTFAEKGGIHKGPKTGNNCVIGAGSVLLGDIIVGANVIDVCTVNARSVYVCSCKSGLPLEALRSLALQGSIGLDRTALSSTMWRATSLPSGTRCRRSPCREYPSLAVPSGAILSINRVGEC